MPRNEPGAESAVVTNPAWSLVSTAEADCRTAVDLAEVYTDAQLIAITQTFKIDSWRVPFFTTSIQRLAWIYKYGVASKETDTLLIPHKRKRVLESHQRKLQASRGAVAFICRDHYLRHALYQVALDETKDQASRRPGDRLQHLSQRAAAEDLFLHHLLAAIERICAQIAKAIARIDADIRNGGDKGQGGNRADLHEQEFIRGLFELYVALATAPRTPDGEHNVSEFLNLLKACAAPLGIKKSHSTLYQQYYRTLREDEGLT